MKQSCLSYTCLSIVIKENMDKTKLKELLNNETLPHFIDMWNSSNSILSFEDFIQQKKKELEEPTYKTFDGFCVNEGDSVFVVDEMDNYIREEYLTKEVFLNKYKFFLKKENAENYLIENVEVLSYEDVIEQRDVYRNQFSGNSFESYLKQKIRQKLRL